MSRYLVPLFCSVALASGVLDVASAQSARAGAQVHLDRARAAAYRPGHSLMTLYEAVCGPALSAQGPVEPRPTDGGQAAPSMADRRIPPRSQWYAEPARVFDNLYWLGSHGDAYSVPTVFGDSTWAVKTSEGIILIDTGNDYSAKELIADGLKKLGEDPAQIKYVILSHTHGDRYFGAKYIQDTYGSRMIMSDADWTAMAQSNEPVELRPKKDMVATDGMKLTLGDTTLTLYITPGHTPGTISTLVPLKDGNARHVGAVWGGINPSVARYGVRYFRDLRETFTTWSGSAARFQDIAAKAGADTYLTIHPSYDNALEKIHALKFRKPGDPHPLVSKDNLNRVLTIIKECTDAQLARITAPGSAQSPANPIESHVAAAKAAAGQHHQELFSQLCAPSNTQPAARAAAAAAPAGGRGRAGGPPPRSEWHAEPAKVFDNLHWVGQSQFSAWALTTSAGIIVIDALYDYSVEDEIVGGLTKLGLNPADIKYVIVSHAHGDHVGGAKFLQDRYKARVILSAADWDLLDQTNLTPRPARDLVATDGQKLTLGDTTITLHLTPGHTPGTMSFLIPVTDRGRRHLVAEWGGTRFSFPPTPENFRTYAASAERFRDLAAKAGADALIANHPELDDTRNRLARLAGRQPGDPHPYVIGAAAVSGYLTVAAECVKAAGLAASSR